MEIRQNYGGDEDPDLLFLPDSFDELCEFIKDKIDRKLYLCLKVVSSEDSVFNRLFNINVDGLNMPGLENICSNKKILSGHALNIVGYNENSFILKNSWGIEWGNFGKFYMKYNSLKENMCAVSISCIDMINIKIKRKITLYRNKNKTRNLSGGPVIQNPR